MTLDLGTLYGEIVYDPDPALRAFRLVPEAADLAMTRTGQQLDRLPDMARLAAQQAAGQVDAQLQTIPGQAGDAGAEAGTSFGSTLKSAGKAGAATAAAAVGGVFIAGVLEAMERDVVEDRLAAAMGGTLRQQERYGRIAGKVFANAYGESLGEAAEGVEAVATTVDDLGKVGGLQRVTEQAFNLSTVLGTELPRTVQIAQQLVDQGLAGNIDRAFDLILAGSRRVPLAVREDLVDAVDEYGPFFAQIGYSGEEMFSLLAGSSEKGMYGIDKAGDAVKEFTLLVTGDIARTKPVIKGLGLDYGDIANDLLAGGDKGVKATNQIIDGLLKIKDPAKQTRAAIELFGTPLEDLGTRDIPVFLESLRLGEEGLGRWQGANERAGVALNDNATTNLESFKRQVTTNFVNLIDQEVLPAVDDWAGRMSTELGPATEDMGKLWEDVGPVIGDVFDWLVNDLFPKVVEGYGTISAAFSDLFDDLGQIVEENPWLEDAFDGLVDAASWLIENIFPAIGAYFETAFPIYADVVGFVVERVEDLAIAFTYVAEYGSKAVGMLVDVFGWGFEMILDFANNAMGWIFDVLDINNPIEDAQAAFSVFQDRADENLDNIATGARLMREALEEEITPEVNIDPAIASLNDLLTYMPGEGVVGGRPMDTVGAIPQGTVGNPGRGRDRRGPRPGDYDDPGDFFGNRAPAGRRGAGRDGGINVEKLVAHDYNDFRRQMQGTDYQAMSDGVRRAS